MNNSFVQREAGPGFDAVVLFRSGIRQIYLSAVQGSRDSFSTLVVKAGIFLKQQNATVVMCTVFAPRALWAEAQAAIEAEEGGSSWPRAIMDGGACGPEAVAGFQIHAVCDVPVQDLRLDGACVGRSYEAPFATHCFVAGVAPEQAADGATQTAQVLGKLEKTLAMAGLGMTNLVRTWFFNDRICHWYGDFNRVRTDAYQGVGILGSGFVPASTGIGAANSHQTALVGGATAVKGKGALRVQMIDSPLQKPASDYGSTFSRAVEICAPDYRQIMISGTASISAFGQTLYKDDAASQVSLTMEIVKAILHSRSMTFNDASRAIVYFKDASIFPIYQDYCDRAGLPNFPAVYTVNDICREDLLFEIELDAIQKYGCL
jgi:enamine deaminase RidA (YjgF/YER057c/UK114 family)